MKSKFISFLLFLIMLVLIAGVTFFGYVIYLTYTDEDTKEIVYLGNDDSITVDTPKENTTKNIGDTISDIISTITTEETAEPTKYSTELSSGKYFYEQLNKNQKILYNGLQENKEKMKTGTYKIEFGNVFSDVLAKENGSDILGDDYQSAIEAFTQDNMDLFYLDITRLYLNIETSRKGFKTKYNVFISPYEGETYYSNEFTNEEQINQAFEKINQQVEEVKTKLKGNTYDDIKTIHNYLVNNVEYDENKESISTSSIYGALVEKKCVCEGYARSFKYLAEIAGIDCVLMQGSAINNSGEQETHAWNAVYLKGKWYLVDATWDDPVIVGKGFVLDSVHYKYFLKGTDNFYKNHTPNSQFTEGGKVFNYPNISAADY